VAPARAAHSDLDVTILRENTEGFYPDRNLAWGYGEFKPTPDVASPATGQCLQPG
jgi:3-isopropylmalate dehydrogenase